MFIILFFEVLKTVKLANKAATALCYQNL